MPRAIRALLIATLLPSSVLAAAQGGDSIYFASFEGLQRVVARSWMAPITTTMEEYRSWDLDDQGTPIPGTLHVSTPSATPAPQRGVGMLSVFVFLFDSDGNAATAWERLDDDLQTTVERDPRAPMMESLPLDGVGDQARGSMGELTSGGITVRHTFATVQDGPFVYSIAGMFSGVDGAALTRGYAEALVTARMDRMVEQFQPDGTSRGGIWSKLNGVQPEMPNGSTVTDLEIWPVPEGAIEELAPLTMEDIAAFPGVLDIAGITYLPDGEAGEGSPSRINAWIVETGAVEAGSIVVYAVADALAEPIAVIASENAVGGSGDETEVLVAHEGFVIDDAMPEGNASIVVRQVGTTIYAAAVYTPDDTSRRVADNVVMAMIDSPSSGDRASRFPQTGDGVLRGLVLVDTPAATPAATPGAHAGSGDAG
jgi:hypothetical protein